MANCIINKLEKPLMILTEDVAILVASLRYDKGKQQEQKRCEEIQLKNKEIVEQKKNVIK